MSRILVTLLRHGRSLADDLRVHEGRFDAPLTEVGRAQAQQRLEEFRTKQLHFDRIISSPPPAGQSRSRADERRARGAAGA